MAYQVPKELRHEYKMLVQRANRRIKSNLKYITKNGITSEHTQRALVGSYNDPLKWSSGRQAFSASSTGRYLWDVDKEEMVFREFKNQTEFKQYLNHLETWGKKVEKGELWRTHPDQIKQEYKDSIIKSLNQVVNRQSISLPNNEIPKEIIEALDDLNIQQISNFFNGGHISEDVEIAQFSSDEYVEVDNVEDFIDVVMTRIHSTTRMYELDNKEIIEADKSGKKRKKRYTNRRKKK